MKTPHDSRAGSAAAGAAQQMDSTEHPQSKTRPWWSESCTATDKVDPLYFIGLRYHVSGID